jgi:hypothetical protein
MPFWAPNAHLSAASQSASGILPEDLTKVWDQEPDKPKQSMIFR